MSKNLSERWIRLLVWPIQSIEKATPVGLFALDKFVADIQTELVGTTLEVRVMLRTGEAAVTVKQKDWPFRVLVELKSILESNEGQGMAGVPEKPKEPRKIPKLESSQTLPTNRANSALKGKDRQNDQRKKPEEVVPKETKQVEAPRNSAPPTDTLIAEATSKDTSNAAALFAESSVSDDSTQSDRELEGVAHDFVPKEIMSRAFKETPTAPTSDSGFGGQSRMFVNLLLAFVALDVLLGGVYLMWRRKKRKAPTKVEPVKAEPKQDVMVVQEQESFLNLLHTNLKSSMAGQAQAPPVSNQIRESEMVATAIKIDDMIASISTALSSLDGTRTPDFEIDPFIKELNALSSSSGQTVNELIGRDGQEFVKNLKNLQKNSSSVKPPT